MKKLIIIGASGHGKVIADIANRNNYSEIMFLDDNANVKYCGDYRVVGNCDCAPKYKDFDFVVAIGNAAIRKKMQVQLMKEGLNIVSLVHPNAIIGNNVELGDGTVVMAGTVINPSVKIGQGCIINTSSSIDHDCIIGDFVHVSVGAHIAGTVVIGNNTWIGAGSTVINNLEISCDCMIGAGAVVVNSIKNPDTYIGVPARRMINK